MFDCGVCWRPASVVAPQSSRPSVMSSPLASWDIPTVGTLRTAGVEGSGSAVLPAGPGVVPPFEGGARAPASH